MEAKLPINAALEKTPRLIRRMRIIRKTSVQLDNLHHPDIYDSISANDTITVVSDLKEVISIPSGEERGVMAVFRD